MKILIAVPCMDNLPVEFVRSLEGMKRTGTTCTAFLANSLVYIAREILAKNALEMEADYILWIDSDMTFEADTLLKLLEDCESGKDVVCGLYFRRRPPYNPALWKEVRLGLTAEDTETVEYDDYPRDSIFEVDSMGFAGVMMKTSVLKKIYESNENAFQPMCGFGEDLSFCIRARKLGIKLWCDSSVKFGHLTRTVVDDKTFEVWRKSVNAESSKTSVEDK